MWKVRVEAEGYNRISFYFDNLALAGEFLELAQKYHKGQLDITIERIYEDEEEV